MSEGKYSTNCFETPACAYQHSEQHLMAQHDVQEDLKTYDMTNNENSNVQQMMDAPQTPIFDLTTQSDVNPFDEETIAPLLNHIETHSTPSTPSDAVIEESKYLENEDDNKKIKAINSPEESPGTPTDSASNGSPSTDEHGIAIQQVDFKSLSFPPHLTAMIESLRGDPQTQIIIVPVLIPHPLSLQQQPQLTPDSSETTSVPFSTPIPKIPANKREIEVNATLWNCSECMMVFKSKFSLTRHKKTHTKEKPFKCDFCPKAFAEKSSRNRHVQTHSGARPWKCAVCDKCFADKVNLKRHVGKAHETQ